jgi:hypothetical protein
MFAADAERFGRILGHIAKVAAEACENDHWIHS